MNLKDR